MPASDSLAASRRRERLLAIMREKDITPAEWARSAGVSSGSLYNFLNKRSNSLSVRTVEKLAAAVQVRVSRITSDEAQENVVSVEALMVRGDVQAGTWVEATEWPKSDWQEVIVPGVPAPYKSVAFGMRVVGPSMNEIYPDKSLLVCVPLHEFHRDPRIGDRVIVQRERAGLYEITVKELSIIDGQPALVPRSSHPNHKAPIRIDDGDIEIRAIVIGSYRPEALD